MAVEVTIEGRMLQLRMTGFDQIWALRRHLEVPIADVVGASVEAKDPLADNVAFRIRGSSIPGLLIAGKYSIWKHARNHEKERQFWLTFRGAEVLVIKTSLPWPSLLVLEVPGARELATMINETINESLASARRHDAAGDAR